MSDNFDNLKVKSLWYIRPYMGDEAQKCKIINVDKKAGKVVYRRRFGFFMYKTEMVSIGAFLVTASFIKRG